MPTKLELFMKKNPKINDANLISTKNRLNLFFGQNVWKGQDVKLFLEQLLCRHQRKKLSGLFDWQFLVLEHLLRLWRSIFNPFIFCGIFVRT